MLSPSDLDAIRSRAEAASNGEWEFDHDTEWVTRLTQKDGRTHEILVILDVYTTEDAAFIAHARTDVPALLDEVERQANRIAELEAAQVPRDMVGAPDDGRDVLLTFTPGPVTKFNTDPKSNRRRTLGHWDSEGYGEWHTCQGRFNSDSFESWLPLPDQQSGVVK